MLRRLVLAPAIAMLAFAMPTQPASADYEVLCVWAEILLELETQGLPSWVAQIPEACAPLVVPVYKIIGEVIDTPSAVGVR